MSYALYPELFQRLYKQQDRQTIISAVDDALERLPQSRKADLVDAFNTAYILNAWTEGLLRGPAQGMQCVGALLSSVSPFLSYPRLTYYRLERLQIAASLATVCAHTHGDNQLVAEATALARNLTSQVKAARQIRLALGH